MTHTNITHADVLQHPPLGILLVHRDADVHTVSLYGNDQGANDVLNCVVGALDAKNDKNIFRLPGLQEPIHETMFERFCESQAIVCGISSGDYAGIEARLIEKTFDMNPELKGKVIFVEDFPGSSGVHNKNVLKVAGDVHFCSIMDLPHSAPERTIYKSVHTVGIPDHWYFSINNILKGERLRKNGIMKRRRGSGVTVPIEDGEIVVYVSGFKDPEMERRILETLLKDSALNIIVHFRSHPGEVSRAGYAEAIKQRDILLEGQWELAVDRDTFTNSLLIGAADLSIVHPGATSTFLMAELKKPAISSMAFVREEHRAGHNLQIAEHFTHSIDSLDDLPAAVISLAHSDSAYARTLKAKQEKYVVSFDANHPMYGERVVEILEKLLSHTTHD